MTDNKKLVNELVIHLKKVGFVKYMVDYINNEIPLTIFPIAKREGLTINEWASDVEDDSGQHTVLTTTRLSYDGVKAFITYKLNTILSSYEDADIKILKLEEVLDVKEIGKKSFDVVFEYNKQIIIIEIKVTQKKDGFTGATHTTSKADTFLLIALSIDRNKKVLDGETYVDGVFSMLINLKNDDWVGKPKVSSSFTGFKPLVGVDYSKNIIYGKLRDKDKHAEIIFQKI